MTEGSVHPDGGLASRSGGAWLFDAFRLDVGERRLTRAGVELALAPKAFDLLVFLVERAGHLVRKTELMEALWPDAFVGEESLARQVSSLRKALGDSPRAQRLIRTVSKSGYRFVAPAERLEPGPAPGPGRTLAVLPFKPLQGDLEQHLALGLADTLIARLAALPELSVRPIHAVHRYAGRDSDALAAGRALRVDTVLDGTLQRDGERLRATVRLVDVADGRTLWAQSFQQAFGDLFVLQDAVATQVATALLPALSSEGRARVTRHESVDPRAYEPYLRGRYVWGQRAPQALQKAVRYFEQALERDPGFAAAHAARADALALLAGYGLPLTAFEQARASAARALQCDPGSPDAHATLGLIAQKSDRDWDRAEDEYQQALRLQPRHLTALQRYGELLALSGRFDEGLELLGRARLVDPASPRVGADLAKANVYARRYPAAVAEARTALDLEPSFARARLYLGLGLLLQGERAAGLGEVQAFAVEEGSAYAAGVLAWAEAAAGRPEQARRVRSTLVARSRREFVPPYALLLAHVAVGEREAALDVLERMLAEGHNVLGLGVSPLLDPLREEPRYRRFRELAGSVRPRYD